MRVLILSQYYDPEPVPKPAELAQELRRRGHEVEVITGFPNYPSGRLYAGFRLGLIRRTVMDGIRVVRAFEFPYHGRNAALRLVNYWSFVLAAPLAALFVRRADVMYVWHPPLTVGVAAWLVSRIRRIPYVYDVQDIWPDTAVMSGMLRPGMMMRAMARLEHFVYRRAAHILVVTADGRENLLGKGVPAGKVSVLPHWIDESIFTEVSDAEREALRERHGWCGEFVVLFAGNIGMMQGLDTLVRAAARLSAGDRIRLVVVGEGTDKERLQALARELEVADRVQFVERQPMSEMPRFMAAADALLVHLRRSELSRYIIPSKTLAYLAAGKPIVMATGGAAADLVREANAGVVIPADDPQRLAETLRRLATAPAGELQAYGRAGKAFLHATMTRNRVAPQYEEILRDVARTP